MPFQVMDPTKGFKRTEFTFEGHGFCLWVEDHDGALCLVLDKTEGGRRGGGGGRMGGGQGWVEGGAMDCRMVALMAVGSIVHRGRPLSWMPVLLLLQMIGLLVRKRGRDNKR